MNERIVNLRKLKEKAMLGGGLQKIEREHKKGKLTARERINLLFDNGSFHEFNLLVKHKLNAPGDGIIIGHGLINGRRICAFAHDATVFGGSQGYFHGKKLYKIYEFAYKNRIPIIGLNDSPGARVIRPDIAGSDDPYRVSDEKHAGVIFYMNSKCSGVIPQISAILGNCTGGSVYSPALTDFIFMVEKISKMFITGPRVIKSVTGEEIDMEKLGGTDVHCKLTGIADIRSKTEEECFSNIKKLISYLPDNCDEAPERTGISNLQNSTCNEIGNIIPSNSSKAYNIKKVIKHLVDNSEFLEIKTDFAKELVTGFARINGYVFGIVGNQPIEKAGCMTVDSSWKQARFVRFCDCFNIPLLLLVDTPGYLPGKEQEYNGIIRHGAKVLYALSEATIPKIAIILRKVYGGAALGMGILPGFGTDMVFSLPYSEIGAMGAEQAVNLFYSNEIKQAENKTDFLNEKIAEYKKHYSDTFALASDVTYIDDIIEPEDMRITIIKAYELLKTKRRIKSEKIHGNIPL